MQYRIIITPAGRPDAFEARLEGSDTVLCVCRTPLLTAARRLLSQGADPQAVIVMRHAGAADDAISAGLAFAAGLTVEERADKPPRFADWTPFCRDGIEPPASQSAPARGNDAAGNPPASNAVGAGGRGAAS